MITRLLLALLASTFGVSCYYDAPPYPGANYQSYGSSYETRSGYSDPWADGGRAAFRVGYVDPHPYSTYSGVGYHQRYHHGPSCPCHSCRSRYHSSHRGHGGHPSHRKTDSRSHSKSKSSSSKKKSSSSSSRSKSSSSSTRSKSSSSSRSRSSGSSSKGDRAKEWQKDKGGNPRAKRR